MSRHSVAGEVITGFTDAISRMVEAFGALAIFVGGGLVAIFHFHALAWGIVIIFFGVAGALTSLYYHTKTTVDAQLPAAKRAPSAKRQGRSRVLESDLGVDDDTREKARWMEGRQVD